MLDSGGGAGARTDVPEPGSHFLGDIFKAISLLLLALGVLLALGAVAAFWWSTPYPALMTQQVRQVGIMKAIGGRSSQVMWMYLAMVVRRTGWAPCSWACPRRSSPARCSPSTRPGVLNFRVESYAPPAWVVWLMVGVGLLVPVLAALVPVRRGARISVVRAFNATGVSSADSSATAWSIARSVWFAACRVRSRSRCATRSFARGVSRSR